MKAKQEKANGRSYLSKILSIREIGVIIPLVIFIILFTSINKKFVDPENMINILRSTSFVFITGIGMTFLLVAGAFDLSVGPQFALAAVLTGMLMQAGVPIIISIILGILSGCVVGAINGFNVIRLKVPAFIATLGMMYALKGVALIIREGVPVYPLPDPFNAIGQENLMGVPYVIIIAVVLGITGHFVLNNTVYGRKLYAVGGNEETSRVAGISVKGIKFSAFMLVSAMASISGILSSSRMGSAQPGAGVGFEMQVIAGAIIGGTSLFGGAGSILGTILGSLFMMVVTNGMTLSRISPYWQQLVLGTVIVVSVAVDQYRISRKGR